MWFQPGIVWGWRTGMLEWPSVIPGPHFTLASPAEQPGFLHGGLGLSKMQEQKLPGFCRSWAGK